MHKSKTLQAFSLFLLISPLTVHGRQLDEPRRPPNVILIMADDLGYETISANGGSSYRTPHLDRLASTGARFEHCYAQPLCTPSRVKIMTGKYNVRNYVRFVHLSRGETTFAHLLKKQGYKTCIAGKWQLGQEPDSPHHFGFDEALLWQHTRGRMRKGTQHDSRYENPRLEMNGTPVQFDNGEYGPDVVCDFICDFIGRHEDQPFLIYYPMILTHCPFVPTPHSEDWNPESQGSKDYKGNPKYFRDMVEYTDRLIGNIVRELEQRNLAENTIVIFTGDNGTDSPVISDFEGRKWHGAKGNTTDAGTRVPLIVSWPGSIQPRVITDLVDFSDFLPTLCDVAGVETPADLELDGRSFLPQLQGKVGKPRSFVYCWFSRNGEADKARVFARTRRHKLYRNGEFYDVVNDPGERQAKPPSSLSVEEKKAQEMLQEVISQYDRYRN